jgi:hypothetical protein
MEEQVGHGAIIEPRVRGKTLLFELLEEAAETG